MPRRVLIIDGSCDPAELTPHELVPYSDLIVLCWLSPDVLGRLREGGRRCYGLLDIVGGLERWERKAIALMELVCQAGQRYQGFPWRNPLIERLFREALVVQAVIDAARFSIRLAGGDAGLVDFKVTAEAELLFRACGGRVEHQGTVTRPNLATRLARRLRRVLLTGDPWSQVWNLLDGLDDTYLYRYAAQRLRRPPRPTTRGVTIFSSYLNNSQTLRQIEPYLPDPIHWIITNRYARLGAAGHRGAMDWLWSFAPRTGTSLAPEEPASPHSVRGGGGVLEERTIQTWLSNSATWSSWQLSGRTALARLTACWESYLDRARPRLVVVAGQWGIEGWLTQIARQRGIAVLQLLHGVLDGEFYTGQPILADALLVWGDLWRDLWPASERSRIYVFRARAAFRPVSRRPPSARPRLTYFSWPLDRLPFYNGADLLDGFTAIFQRLLEASACELTIRAHPLENPADVVDRWRRRSGSLPPGIRISQNEPLRSVLKTTDLAIMYRSTVMLDCLASRIPIVIPGWIKFDWMRRLTDISGIHLASSFHDLEAVLHTWLVKLPEIDLQQTRSLLQAEEVSSEDLLRLLNDLTAGAVAARGSVTAEVS